MLQPYIESADSVDEPLIFLSCINNQNILLEKVSIYVTGFA